ncbi:putative S1/P1 Nuclease [Tenacibaculum maritimum]|uniref:S1/P1 nuclease n=1 Tax=Tenacibaculum maritimum TaxID=107401 RepID=UPI0012E46D96|nr:S1/P1 nuclease [Tenacibaculum maritimum]CAA0144092.1 putative S1/P1 Nuclease [Tenacibaculum maritimum]CAA0164656.1 putative S1/P1 Nuclease [Tenacibaculum maritimum]CAA0172801.1 putative S1/P1 Nuclease [Tenacibaculum maritimum]
MKKIIFSILGACFLTVSSLLANNITADDWGQTGHRVIGEIAQGYLSGRAKRKINKLLKGQGLAIASTFGDEIKSDKRYRKFYAWHYVNLNDGETYETSEKNPNGDLYTGILKCKEVITDENASEEDKAFYLKLLVHLVGDLHQPLHIGRAHDKGGNDFQVQWFKEGSNLHRVWDSEMIEHYNMTYSELASNAGELTRKEVREIQKGTLLDWVEETRGLAQQTYDSAKIGDKLGYRYMYENFGTVRKQLQKGGIRLAKILNDIF